MFHETRKNFHFKRGIRTSFGIKKQKYAEIVDAIILKREEKKLFIFTTLLNFERFTVRICVLSSLSFLLYYCYYPENKHANNAHFRCFSLSLSSYTENYSKIVNVCNF